MTFVLKKKKLHIYENVFLYFVIVFLITTYYAILYVNIEVWEVSSKNSYFFIFRVVQLITLPLFLTWYFNILGQVRTLYIKGAFSLFVVAIAYVLEYILVQFKVIIYKDWSWWQSLVFIVLILLLTNLFYKVFRNILRKEGGIT